MYEIKQGEPNSNVGFSPNPSRIVDLVIISSFVTHAFFFSSTCATCPCCCGLGFLRFVFLFFQKFHYHHFLIRVIEFNTRKVKNSTKCCCDCQQKGGDHQLLNRLSRQDNLMGTIDI